MLNRLILANLLNEIYYQYLFSTIIIVQKPLYRILEAGTHWWAIYYKYYKEKLYIITLLYNLCLLITTKKEAFKVVGM
jgi:N-glycosylase/DNA lyase